MNKGMTPDELVDYVQFPEMVNATARNYYLTVARELRETVKPE